MRYILAGLFAFAVHPALAADACHALLPEALKASAAASFPAFRVPNVADNLVEDAALSSEQTGNSCLGVAKADFDGNGKLDWLLGLTVRNGNGALVLVALSVGGKWRFHEL